MIAWLGSTREKNRVRARASFFLFFIFYSLSRYLLAIFGIPPSKRKEKSGTHQSGCARSPQRFFLFFYTPQGLRTVQLQLQLQLQYCSIVL